MGLNWGKISLFIWLEEDSFIPKAPPAHRQVSGDTTSRFHLYEQKGGLEILVIFFCFGNEPWKTGGSGA